MAEMVDFQREQNTREMFVELTFRVCDSYISSFDLHLNWHVPWRTNLSCVVSQISYAPSSNLVDASIASSE